MRLDVLRAKIQRGLVSGPTTPFDMAEVRAEGHRLRALRLDAGVSHREGACGHTPLKHAFGIP